MHYMKDNKLKQKQGMHLMGEDWRNVKSKKQFCFANSKYLVKNIDTLYL